MKIFSIFFLVGFILAVSGTTSNPYNLANPYGVFIVDGGHHTKPHGGLAGNPFWKPKRRPILHPSFFPSNLHKRTSLQSGFFLLTSTGTLIPIVPDGFFQDMTVFVPLSPITVQMQNTSVAHDTFGSPTTAVFLQPDTPPQFQSPDLFQVIQPTTNFPQIDPQIIFSQGNSPTKNEKNDVLQTTENMLKV